MDSVCKFCGTADRKFTCPRCSADYCGLQCYQSPAHQQCSEQFYKQCVKQELSLQQVTKEGRQQMIDILQRVNKEEEEEEDSDDEEEPLELEERLKGVNLDDAEEIWSKLTKDERDEFDGLIKSGDVSSVLPEYTAWWTVKVKQAKIHDLSEPEDETYKLNCPAVPDNIPALSSLCRNPSEFCKFGLLNLLYAYAYAVRYFSGDYSDPAQVLEFCEAVQLLSRGLAGQNYQLADTAIECAASQVQHHHHLTVSLHFSRSVKKDVVEIVKGPTGSDNYYILAGLADLKKQLQAAGKLLKAGKAEDPQMRRSSRLPAWLQSVGRRPQLQLNTVRQNVRKVDFYLAWSKERYQEFSDILR